jgi:hypothetical protein
MPHTDASMQALIDQLTSLCLAKLQADGRQRDVMRYDNDSPENGSVRENRGFLGGRRITR